MKKLTIALSALAVLFSYSFAGAVMVDTKASSFKWTGSKKFTDSFHYGKLKLKSAKVEMKGDKLAGGEFVMDMKSMTVDDLSGSMEKKFLGHVKSGDFFLVEKHPEAKLVINSISGNKAKGNLTIKGITKPITVDFKKDGNTFNGTMVFNRTDFGINYGTESLLKKAANYAADKVIDEKVKLEFAVVTKGDKKSSKKAKGQSK